MGTEFENTLRSPVEIVKTDCSDSLVREGLVVRTTFVGQCLVNDSAMFVEPRLARGRFLTGAVLTNGRGSDMNPPPQS